MISTPVTVVSGLGGAARRGILIKGGIHLEQARRLKIVALDKTGTLTYGKPGLTDFIALYDQNPDDIVREDNKLDQNVRGDLLRIAASLEILSEHPVAHAIVSAHIGSVDHVDGFNSIIGRGVRGRINGIDYLLGNHRLVEETGVRTPAIEAILDGFENDAKTSVVLMAATKALAVFGVADTLRVESVQAIKDLIALGKTSQSLWS